MSIFIHCSQRVPSTFNSSVIRPLQHLQLVTTASRRHLMGGGEAATSASFMQAFAVYGSHNLFSESFIECYQALAALSWVSPGAAVLATTLSLRFITIPLFIYSEKLSAKRMIATNIIQQQVSQRIARHYGVKAAIDEHTGQWTVDTADKLILRNMTEIYRSTLFDYAREHRIQMGRIICLKLSTFPIWMYSSIALRDNLTNTLQPANKFLWMDALTQSDPYFILPLSFMAISFLNMWGHRWMFINPSESRFKSYIINGSLIFVMFAGGWMLTKMPAIQSSYWIIVLSTNLIQTLLFRHPKVKRYFGIGRLPTDTERPFHDLFRFRRRLMMPEKNM